MRLYLWKQNPTMQSKPKQKSFVFEKNNQNMYMRYVYVTAPPFWWLCSVNKTVTFAFPIEKHTK